MRHLDKAGGGLLRRLGAGRYRRTETGGVALDYRRIGGDGLVLSALLEDTPVRLWLDEAQWCRWIAPVLSVPCWASVPAALRDILAAWTLAGNDAGLAQEGVSWPAGQELVPVHVALMPDWCLSFERNGDRLDVRLLDVPPHWIEALMASLPQVEPASVRVDRVPVSLIAGWSLVGESWLRQLVSGAALLLSRCHRVTEGEIGLFSHLPLACLRAGEDGCYRVEETMEESGGWNDAVMTPEGAALTVVAEVGTLQVPLGQLGGLRRGDVLEGVPRLDGGVLLKIAGQPIASGMLLEIGGRLAVRVDRIC